MRELIDLTMQIHVQTESAVLASLTGVKDDAVWLPISQIEIDRPSPSRIAEITMPEWLAVEKGLV